MSNVQPLPVDYVISAIAPQFLSWVWEECAPHIERVVESSHGDITLASTRNRIVSGDLQLFAISRHGEIVAVFCTDVQTLESGLRALRVPIIGGDEMDDWIEQAIATWKKLAKELMCDCIRGLGRAGWARRLKCYEVKTTHVVYQLDLED